MVDHRKAEEAVFGILQKKGAFGILQKRLYLAHDLSSIDVSLAELEY